VQITSSETFASCLIGQFKRLEADIFMTKSIDKNI